MDVKKLRENVAIVNSICGTSIRTVGVKREAMVTELKAVVTANIEKLPSEVVAFVSAISVEPEKPPEVVMLITTYGNTQEILMAQVASLNAIEGVSIVTDGKTLQEIEESLIEALDGLTEESWASLPDATKAWDVEITEKIKAAAASEKETKKKAEKGTDKETKKKTDKETKKKPDKETKKKTDKGTKSTPVGPRPDFKFSEGTSSYAIIELFNKMFKESKGAGIKIDDLRNAAEAAKIKSNNIKGRVNITVRYSMTPEGGEQIVKVGNFLYPKGKQPK